MSSFANESHLRRTPVVPDPNGTEHWFVTSHAPVEDCANAFTAFADLSRIEVWTVDALMAQAGAGGVHALPTAIARWFPEEADLFWALEHSMHRVHAGLRIYAVGAGQFTHSVRQLAGRIGIAPGLVRISHRGAD
ncbi:hypothetical protein M3A49_32300 [Paraburkholderia sp. CNPSo 3076]|uniref:hypothetical protein n=1 Tax=Paraburkholderia sp. CNPSo 3076 TaxID=2940936 RepID=UPI002252698C|nr:hypothetical protein [Paraburkholderia sp. CNPSo 3076]MCX5544110.1 hypothetical protein [Paraburkholderia sp. CNPSo 3076]